MSIRWVSDDGSQTPACSIWAGAKSRIGHRWRVFSIFPSFR